MPVGKWLIGKGKKLESRATIRARSILATRSKYSYDVLKDDDVMRRGSRGFSTEIKQAIIDKQDKLIVNWLNNHHGEYSRTEIAKALDLDTHMVKNKLSKLTAQGKILRIKLERPRVDKVTVVFKGVS